MNNIFTINDISGKCDQAVEYAHQFLPYAHKKLGFNKPVSINLLSDPENAKDPLGKTGYYDPNKMEITIFVDKRHIKDILRSLSHELVHHSQNCRGEFDRDIETGSGYAQKNPHMRKMEGEAYLLGNGFLFRDWEDQRKQPGALVNENISKEKKTMAKLRKENPDHYCIYRGGIYMEGEVKQGKVIGHKWNKKLKKITKYDMHFGKTIVRNIPAEKILVTEGHMGAAHPDHEVSEDLDEDVIEENQVTLPPALQDILDGIKAAIEKITPSEGTNLASAKLDDLFKKFTTGELVVTPAKGSEAYQQFSPASGELAGGIESGVPAGGAMGTSDPHAPHKKLATSLQKLKVPVKSPGKEFGSPELPIRESYKKKDKNDLLFEELTKKWSK